VEILTQKLVLSSWKLRGRRIIILWEWQYLKAQKWVNMVWTHLNKGLNLIVQERSAVLPNEQP